MGARLDPSWALVSGIVTEMRMLGILMRATAYVCATTDRVSDALAKEAGGASVHWT